MLKEENSVLTLQMCAGGIGVTTDAIAAVAGVGVELSGRLPRSVRGACPAGAPVRHRTGVLCSVCEG
jgi:hypothetical protein